MTNVIQVIAAALYVRNGTTLKILGQLRQPFIRRTQINCVQVSGSLRQMDVADKCLWSTIRLGWLPRGSKLHVMLLLCMCRNHTHLCTALRTNLTEYILYACKTFKMYNHKPRELLLTYPRTGCNEALTPLAS